MKVVLEVMGGSGVRILGTPTWALYADKGLFTVEVDTLNFEQLLIDARLEGYEEGYAAGRDD